MSCVYKNEYSLIQKFSVSDFNNNVTEFSNNKITCEATRSPFSEGKRSLERDLNSRPNAYEALTKFIFVNLFNHSGLNRVKIHVQIMI